MLKILMVDDSKTILRVLKNVLTRMLDKDTVFLEAYNGEEALNVVEENNDIDIILLDVNMPIMTGDKFLEIFRSNKDNNKVKVVMVTTEAEKKTVIKIMKLGANGFIVKPFTPEILRKSLDPILRRLGVDLKEV